ncbi:MFS transporter [Sphaerisporangium corydalis]|uniref:MFS transporter n=1 Tax=Sphaerisporangium corydalis TaxID=1441875 RepID=A0ABV9E865_9ACTN|nr:MFS transporter [Sphaerisporangium corydalis]
MNRQTVDDRPSPTRPRLTRLRAMAPEPGAARVLAAATLVNTFGNGLWMTCAAFFLTRSAGLAVWQVGAGLTLAALVSTLVSTPMGYLADRYGPRGMLVGFLLAQSAAGAALVLVGSFPAFLVVSALIAVTDSGAAGARGSLIGGAVPAGERVRTRAYLRAVTNVGLAGGAACAGFGIAVDTRPAYLVMILGNAATYLVAAAICVRAPSPPPARPPAGGPRLVALRDLPFLVYTVVDGLSSTHFVLIQLVVPLWIAARTEAPRWLVAVLFVLNTTAVVALQVRASRGTDTPSGAARASRSGGICVAVACLLFAGSSGTPAPVAVALLVAGALAHVMGELRQSAAGWSISFALAPPHAQGQYQGAHSMGILLGHVIAPAALTGLVFGGGTLGWLVCAAVFAALGFAVAPVVRWAERTR